ncbi:hypothetical protein JOB18_016962 [Solea senegalensis]|uniref:Uncharacterized protein n=1 Tax=Solea senegalensis TaxID=28829 RepID=A0AAV6S570_SOLSE|nr:hypothetical protein JOB18_016962 [Solea senegalensis]
MFATLACAASNASPSQGSSCLGTLGSHSALHIQVQGQETEANSWLCAGGAWRSLQQMNHHGLIFNSRLLLPSSISASSSSLHTTLPLPLSITPPPPDLQGHPGVLELPSTPSLTRPQRKICVFVWDGAEYRMRRCWVVPHGLKGYSYLSRRAKGAQCPRPVMVKDDGVLALSNEPSMEMPATNYP